MSRDEKHRAASEPSHEANEAMALESEGRLAYSRGHEPSRITPVTGLHPVLANRPIAIYCRRRNEL